MSLTLVALTTVHVALSLAGIVAGFVVLYGFLTARRLERWNGVFLATTIATSATGFLFPVDRFLPSHAFGILSLALLAVVYVARYRHQLAGSWNLAYVLTAIGALYLNVFVLVVQTFLKVPALKALAPTQTEPVFAVSQLLVLAAFVGAAVVAGRRASGERLQLTSAVMGR